jgi:hypothetical protein
MDRAELMRYLLVWCWRRLLILHTLAMVWCVHRLRRMATGVVTMDDVVKFKDTSWLQRDD